MYRLFRFENMFSSEGSPEGPCQASVERKYIGTMRKKSMNRSKAIIGDLAEIRAKSFHPSSVIMWMISSSVSRMPIRASRPKLAMEFSTPLTTRPSPA